MISEISDSSFWKPLMFFKKWWCFFECEKHCNRLHKTIYFFLTKAKKQKILHVKICILEITRRFSKIYSIYCPIK